MRFIVIAACLATLHGLALAQSTFRYVAEPPEIEVLPGSATPVVVYLEESFGSGGSVLDAENGLFSAGFSLSRLAGTASDPARLAGLSALEPNTVDFFDSTNVVFGPVRAVLDDGASGRLVVFARSAGRTGSVVSPGVRRIRLCNMILTAGAFPNQTSQFQIVDIPTTEDTITWTNQQGLDPQIQPASLTVICNNRPVNDSCALAAPVGEGDYTFSTRLCTTDGPAEPARFGAADPQIASDLWFRFTPTLLGTHRIQLCGSSFDTRLAVYLGSCPTSATALTANDDACGTSSEVVLDVPTNGVGASYLIRVGGRAGTSGLGRLRITGCPADLDNGIGAGVRDGAVNIDDLTYFLDHFEVGDEQADLDNGTNQGVSDGAVTIDDLLYFLVSFETGC